MINIILFSIILGVLTSLVSIFLTEKITNLFFNKKEFSENYIMFSKAFYIFFIYDFFNLFLYFHKKILPSLF